MDQEENDMMTRVGPGTPAGETLRCYWLPVSFSDEIQTDEPKIVRRLAEDLLLFRDEFGRVGLTEPTCPPSRHVARIRLDRSRRHPLLLSRLGLRCDRTLHRTTR